MEPASALLFASETGLTFTDQLLGGTRWEKYLSDEAREYLARPEIVRWYGGSVLAD
jgi:hypothetical protein